VFLGALATADKRSETEIPAEKINGPILLISGGDDALWPSQQMADTLVARLKAKGFRHEVLHLTYPKAGHAVFVGAPDGPMARGFTTAVPMLGGSPEANAQAWADDWPKALAFFHKALKGGAS
jgi:dienelactone hydrolase